MRQLKELSKEVRHQPEKVKDRHWEIFCDYRDSEQSADSLASLYTMSRSQIQNIIHRVINRSHVDPSSRLI